MKKSMLNVKGLDLDEEALFYLSAFYHKSEVARARSVISSGRVPHSISTTFMSRVVCYRCGAVGHMSRACDSSLPSLEAMESAMEKDVNQIISSLQRAPNMMSDEFGLYSTESKSPVKIDSNWKSVQFCHNCGKAGHVRNKCPNINFDNIAFQMGDCLLPRSKIPAKEIERFFWDLWE
jgi:hypothetical protein